ncbi:CoA transferase subunit A [Thermoactinomyces sp. CICC 24227]|jgi:glutaconate CoA-transferase subunit A|uniref:CoA transferase subunit A n=1 Tax=Thermoactinomyces sp. CICC 24227 TaxID=2767432 RepID=UPI0018DE6D1B|nr:CoA transferase subunit A [Thermoactinomyces sp. CICC 24227]MBI0385968.1 CoA transferase subunit A [Thermoactinomyces sp. CICC 24227]
MRQTKRMSLEQAMADLVKDGESVVMGACLEAMIPFAAAYELIRQKKENLTLIAPISDILFDVMIGAGAVDRLIAAWSGNVSAGLGYNYRRAMEKGVPRPLKVEDHSNFTIGLALLAGAMGVPFLPTRSLLGSDLLKTNPKLQVGTSPLGEEKLVYVPALTPDVAILGVQRADEFGNAHLWGNFGVAQEAALASKKVILLAEEIVPGDVITSDPNRLLVPGFKVSAVVHCPGFCHPSPMPGYYQRDHSFFHDYHQESKDEEGFRKWLNQWVLSVSSHEEYLRLLGSCWERLKIKKKALAAEVNYAYE